MKKNTLSELKSKTVSELNKDIAKAIDELGKLKIDLKIGKLKNTSSLRFKADELAILKTLLREKELFSEENKK